jgi:dethiobiotin synthetase
LRGLFITGTDTGVGKTVLAAAIVAALRARGAPVKALKPVITGLDEPPDPDWPPDHELLANAADCTPEQVSPLRYGPPVSPHLAAKLSARPISPARLRGATYAAARNGEALIVEGVGGLLVPIADNFDVRALVVDLGLPLLIAARPGLGTINHTLLTLEAARNVALNVAGVVLTPWPENPGEIERSNHETIARRGGVAVSTLPRVERAEVDLLAEAGAGLPLDEWLA